MIKLFLTLIIGILGGTTALKFKVPAGAMIGSMLSVSVYNIFTGNAYLPQNIRIITQIAAGAYIGAKISGNDVKGLKLMVKPAALMLTSMIILDILMGFIMYKFTRIDLVTSLFACAPGGLVDMSLISHDLGADTSKVAILQIVRLMTVLMVLPLIIKNISFKSREYCVDSNVEHISIETGNKNINKKTVSEKSINLLLTIIVAAIAGSIGYFLNIPAGAMTFAMFSISFLNVVFDKGYMPLSLRRLTQMFAGVLIGERMTYGDIISLKNMIIPAIILLLGVIIVNMIIGIVVNKVTCLELTTSLFASAPGGMSDMALIAEDFGADAPKVAILQLARYATIIAVYPIIIKILR